LHLPFLGLCVFQKSSRWSPLSIIARDSSQQYSLRSRIVNGNGNNFRLTMLHNNESGKQVYFASS
jgi:hypothetical protein